MARYARRPAGQRVPPGPWRFGSVPVVGLTGGIGAGKSVVAVAFAGRGAEVTDADAIGHTLLQKRPARDQVLERFGPEGLAPETETETETDQAPAIDRKALGAIVFNNRSALRDLESILHPLMRRTFQKAIRRTANRREAPMVVLDAAVLLEAGWDDLCDWIVFVEASEGQRLARLNEQRQWSAEQLASREAAQWPLDRKRAAADLVIANDDGPEELEPQIQELWRRLRQPPPPRRPRQPSSDRPAADPASTAGRSRRPKPRSSQSRRRPSARSSGDRSVRGPDPEAS